MNRPSSIIYHPSPGSRYPESGTQAALYSSRECSTNHPFFCKTNPIFQRKKLMQDVYLQRLIKNARPPAEQKQTQFKPNSNPIKPNNESKIRGAKPIQTQFITHLPMSSVSFYYLDSGTHLDLTLINRYNIMFNEYLSEMR